MGLKIRRDTAATWTSVDPTLEQAEQGYETDTGKWKFGDGVTAWTLLPYSALGNVTGQASSVDSEVALFSGTGGKTIKRATTTGILKGTSGVLSAAVANTDYATPNQDTTGKSAKTDALNSATTVVNVAAATAPTTGQVLTATGASAATWQTPAAGGVAWGAITGTLSSQTDLNTALAGKAATANNLSDLSDAPTARWNLKIPSQSRVLAVATTNITLSGLQTIDGVSLAANNTVLLTGQTAGAENGPWQAQVGAWTRPTGFQSGGIVQTATIPVASGSTNYPGSMWVMTNTGNVTIDTTATTWVMSNTNALQTLTNKDVTSGTNTFPTFNQNTTGSAAKLTTARNIAGVAFDGTANISLTTGSAIQKALSGGLTGATAGTDFYAPGSTDVAITDGGTGVSTLPTGILKGAGTGAITAVTAPSGAVVGDTDTQTLSNKDLTAGTNTFPTLNQNTTGSAAKWTTARNLAGNSVDGSAAVAFANKFIVQGTTDTGLSAAQFLGALGTGLVKNTTTTGVLSIAAAGTDYSPATVGTGILKGNGSGGTSTATAGTDYTSPASTETQTNKRRTARVFSTASTATLTPEIDTYDAFTITAQAAALNIANHSTSTPTDFEQIRIRILDNGTSRGLSFGTNYVARGGVPLPTNTVISKYTELLFEWNGTTSKFHLLAVAQEV